MVYTSPFRLFVIVSGRYGFWPQETGLHDGVYALQSAGKTRDLDWSDDHRFDIIFLFFLLLQASSCIGQCIGSLMPAYCSVKELSDSLLTFILHRLWCQALWQVGFNAKLRQLLSSRRLNEIITTPDLFFFFCYHIFSFSRLGTIHGNIWTTFKRIERCSLQTSAALNLNMTIQPSRCIFRLLKAVYR